MGKSFARYSAFARGRIVGMADAGASRLDIAKTVLKTDGKRGTVRAVRAIVSHARTDENASRTCVSQG